MARSAYDIFRRRIAPIAFLGALLLLATRTCSSEMASVTFVFDLGDRQTELRSLEVELLRADEADPVATFKSSLKIGAAGNRPQWKLKVDPGPYTLRIRIASDRRTYRVTRSAQVRDGAEITVRLTDVVTSRAGPARSR